jgi:hypothetical protein
MGHHLSLAIFLGASLSAVAHGQAIGEYQVKAAFLYNFAKFVEWPPQTFKNFSEPIKICVLGQDPFGQALEEAVSGKHIEGRALLVRNISAARQAGNCQILFVSSSERKRLPAIFVGIKAAGILTVGEMEGFTAEGGVVNFRLENGRVRIEVNVQAAEQGRLRISSKLLSLAQIVKR